MARERNPEYKPLSFSTTMRNPSRIAAFLNCILPFEGQILTNEIIFEVISLLIKRKLYTPMCVKHDIDLKNAYQSEREFNDSEVKKIIKNSPQNHKEAGFDKGWPSRFDTWYKLSMEFGFIYYKMNKPIIISISGHMLLDAFYENPVNDKKIQNIFLNALMKYQTNNPFRKNANDTAPLILLLQVIKLLKDDPEENNSGIHRNELSLIICWPNRNAEGLYNLIKILRKKYGFNYSDEVIYYVCLKLLGTDSSHRNRFKINQITGEAVDEFIRKMRVTGIISIRGNGRFIDFNSFELKKIEYILKNYTNYNTYSSKKEFFEYIGTIDTNIVSLSSVIKHEIVDDIKIKTLNKWATKYTKDEIIKELKIIAKKGESKNNILKFIDKPTRLEFLTSIALKQNFIDLDIRPNYHVDDEGIPTFTASGGLADIECFDEDCNSLVEVTLMCARTQAINEIPAITRHLQDAIEKYPNKTVFSMIVAPSIHPDTKYMAGFTKYKYNIDILTLNIAEFIEQISTKNHIIEML